MGESVASEVVPGAFLCLEGPDGAGKSTQARRLVAALQRVGLDPVLVREPGGTALGERVRDLLLGVPSTAASADKAEGVAIGGRAELFLFLASRAQLTEEVIRPALRKGRVVVADRFYASTAIYQGYADGTLSLEQTIELSLSATGGVRPDLTILLQLSAEASRKRTAAAGPRDRIESRPPAYFQRVVAGYRLYPDLAPEPVQTVPGDLCEAEVEAKVYELVRAFLFARGLLRSEAEGVSAAAVVAQAEIDLDEQEAGAC